MKEYPKNNAQSLVKEDTPFMKTFASQEEAERYNMIQNVERSDIEKFKAFCRMVKIGRMLANAKIITTK